MEEKVTAFGDFLNVSDIIGVDDTKSDDTFMNKLYERADAELCSRLEARAAVFLEREEKYCRTCWRRFFCKQHNALYPEALFPIKKGIRCKHEKRLENRIDELYEELLAKRIGHDCGAKIGGGE